MKVVFRADGVLTQFEGYERLREFDWKGYREKYGDIHRLDRVLEAEGDKRSTPASLGRPRHRRASPGCGGPD